MTEAQAVELVGRLAEDGYGAQAISTTTGVWSVEVFPLRDWSASSQYDDDLQDDRRVYDPPSPDVTGIWNT